MHSTSNVYANITAQLPAQVVATLAELFGDDLQQWRFIIDLFSETVEQDLVSLEKAIRGSEVAQIIEAAHRIVGSARMLGHQPIGDTARIIERSAHSARPYQERAAQMQSSIVRLRALADEFRELARGFPWPDSTVAG
jgi:HPt (histidine-containing phosphotransfer) domain-containing protein